MIDSLLGIRDWHPLPGTAGRRLWPDEDPQEQVRAYTPAHLRGTEAPD